MSLRRRGLCFPEHHNPQYTVGFFGYFMCMAKQWMFGRFKKPVEMPVQTGWAGERVGEDRKRHNRPSHVILLKPTSMYSWLDAKRNFGDDLLRPLIPKFPNYSNKSKDHLIRSLIRYVQAPHHTNPAQCRWLEAGFNILPVGAEMSARAPLEAGASTADREPARPRERRVSKPTGHR